MVAYLKDIYAAIHDVAEQDKYIFRDHNQLLTQSIDHKDSPHFSVAWMTSNPDAFIEYRTLLDILEQMYAQLHRIFKICAPNHLTSQKVIVYVGFENSSHSRDSHIMVDCNCDPFIPLRMYTMSALRNKTAHMIGLNITKDRYVYDVIVSFLIAHTFPEKYAPTFRIVRENSHFAIDSAHNTQYSKSYNRHRIGYSPEDGYHLLNFVTKSYGINAIACVIHELKLHSNVLLLETIASVVQRDLQSVICDYICDVCKVFSDVVFTKVTAKELSFFPNKAIECMGFHAIDLAQLSPSHGLNYKISWTCSPRQDMWRVIVFTPNPIVIASGYESFDLNATFKQFIVFSPCFRCDFRDSEPSYSFKISL